MAGNGEDRCPAAKVLPPPFHFCLRLNSGSTPFYAQHARPRNYW